jgi:PTS system fructose-specific IIC component/PTS system nitrogen regulatory IIA component
MKLTDRLTEACVIVDSLGATWRAIVAGMVDRLCEVHGLGDNARILDAVVDRESKMSTGIGCGLAIPHAKVNFLDEMLVAACSVKRGLDCDAIDKQPVYLLFLIVSPEATVGPHIRALSAISRLLSDADVRRALIQAGTPAEFHAGLVAGEAKYA